MWPTHWPTVARDIAEAVDAAIAAARSSDAAALTEAAANLAEAPAEQVRVVLAAVVRELLETLHPDGLTGEDVQDVLGRCTRAAAVWLPAADVDAFVSVLTGALGVTEIEENPRTPEHAVEAAILVIADLSTTAGASATDYLRRALDEIARAETVEMP
ncbi:hypothetical protein [Rhodococcus tibetensis]|uniref:DUF222 domain-containing protein n=1 Tax=Rhodococcus tibetensis TaxID=2965064 RepID=A0ABT1QG26_9NOCA|nr:hypothetical protein [Rhodococcus sp. FXJ9.536]MCQ4121205.1 hypothetical protein [Rhodococcus sp. FXJ9.536]